VINALGQPQSLLLLGGTSDIGLAIAERYVHDGARRVVLAARPSPRLEAAEARLRAAGAQDVTTLPFEAGDTAAHRPLVEHAFAGGDLDVVVLAFGLLGDQERAEADVDHALDVVSTNYTAAVSVGVPLAQRLRQQGHGALVVLSSVAGERPRRSNYLYGSAKAGLDAFATGLGEALRGTGVHVLVVRPGFVRTRMTEHLAPAPLSTTADAVAEAVVTGLRRGKQTVWVPGTMRFVMSGLRHLPRSVFRKLPV
jgi:decaprenylphospho-beta-D-erythro-pentofuranosid-2-ulose 2-reductase